MAQNNTVKLIGNLGDKVRVVEKDDKMFSAFSLATHDSYKDKEGNYQQKAAIWHNVLVFNPKLVELSKTFEKGARIEVNGSLSYRPFKFKENGKPRVKHEASVIAQSIDPAPLGNDS